MQSAKEQYVIIVAGGTGSRMNSAIPKQFIEIGGEAIILRTLRCFLTYNLRIRIIICVHKGFKNYLEELIDQSGFEKTLIRIVEGGSTRFESVKNGLACIDDVSAIVGIHDAARPFVSQQTIHNCFSTAAIKGNAIPCVSVNESLRELSNASSRAVNRSDYRVVQTPQCFEVAAIKEAFLQSYAPAFTDDATVLEAAGGQIHLVEGNVENIKITSPFDLLITNALLNQ